MEKQPKVGKNRGNAGKGRPKGSQNKITQAVKDAVQAAFDEVGGVDYLVVVAKEDHKTFCQLLGKVIPTQVNAAVTMAEMTKEQRDAVIAAASRTKG